MLENIREKSQGVTAKIILGFIILTFALAGIGSYTNSVDTSVADVNGEKISQQDFETAFQQQRNRMSQQFGEMFESLLSDPTYLNNLRNDVLSKLINEKLLDQNSSDLAIRVSDEAIKKTIVEMKEFQVDGVFDNNRYLALINQAGFRESSSFRDYLRVQMARTQLTQSIVASEFSLPYQADMLTALRDQTRDIRFTTIAAEQFKAQVEVTDEEIANHYEMNQATYQNAEQAKVDYVLIDLKQVVDSIEVTDADAQVYYNENKINFTTPERRRIAHILIELGDDAQAKAVEVLAKVKAGGDFAELAKEYSADTASAENGGDLEWLEPDVMVADFETAAMALTNAGDVSEVVETEFGFHIIKLTELVAAEVTSFEDAKVDILAEAAQQAAEDKFYQLKEELGRVSYELPDSLDESADVVEGQVETSEWLSRGQNIAPFDNNKVISAVFSDTVLTENLNSDVIDISDELAIVVRLNEYQAAEVKPLEEVTDAIRATLVTQKANVKAQTIADELLAKYSLGDDISAQLDELGSAFEEKVAVKRTGSDVNGSIVRKAFTLPHPKSEALSVANLSLNNGDIALIQVLAVKDGVTSDTTAQVPAQLANQLAQAAYTNYVESLSENADITRRAIAQGSTLPF